MVTATGTIGGSDLIADSFLHPGAMSNLAYFDGHVANYKFTYADYAGPTEFKKLLSADGTGVGKPF